MHFVLLTRGAGCRKLSVNSILPPQSGEMGRQSRDVLYFVSPIWILDMTGPVEAPSGGVNLQRCWPNAAMRF
jgi:hypothetical protein